MAPRSPPETGASSISTSRAVSCSAIERVGADNVRKTVARLGADADWTGANEVRVHAADIATTEVDDELDLNAPIEETLEAVARAKRVRPRDLMVVILDRPRHDEMVKRIRAVGTRIRFIPHGDVSGALMAASPDTGIDLLWGIGGTPEGVLSAAAFKCLGGQFQGKLWPRDDAERKAAIDAGYDLDRVLLLDDLVRGDNTFFAATGVTDGDLLRGVRYQHGGARTHSLVMRSKSGTVRTLQATHSMEKLGELAGTRYD